MLCSLYLLHTHHQNMCHQLVFLPFIQTQSGFLHALIKVNAYRARLQHIHVSPFQLLLIICLDETRVY